MRVMEDAARFVLDDAALSGELKSLRHDFRAALEHLPAGWIEANRDTPGDVGTSISTPSEKQRAGMPDVAVAAGKRLSEALRVIEEAGKTIDPYLAGTIETIRYRAYDLEQRLHLRMGAGRARQWRVCVLLTESICAKPWDDVLKAIIDGGCDCIQVREKDEDGGALAARVKRVIEIARPAGVSVIVNDRADIALVTGADGVHLGQGDLSVHDVRRIAGRSLLIGSSTHDLDEASAAVEAGADYCGVGAMFASSLKPDRTPSGTDYLRAFIERYPNTPHLAIGGVKPENIGKLVKAGVRGVAVSRAVCGAAQPDEVMRVLRSAIDAGA
jgi:thiamine-phosphate pyrophosphorylase